MSGLNLASVLAHHADRFPDRPCLVWDDAAITYAELDRRAARTAGGRAGLGGGPRAGGGAPRPAPPPPLAEVAADDVHRLMYTSGTTARPKGVMITHANLYWKNIAHVVEVGITGEDKAR